MTRGQVLQWNDPKGIGIIRMEDGAQAFVSHQDLRMEGVKSLREGQWVSFDVELSRGAARAVNVVASPEPAEPPEAPPGADPAERSARGIFVVFFDVADSHEDGWVAVAAPTRAEAERLADEKLPSLDMQGMLADGPHRFVITESMTLEAYEDQWPALDSESVPKPGEVKLLEIGS